VNFDSGSPVFFVHEGKPVLVSAWFTPTTGPNYLGASGWLQNFIDEFDILYGDVSGETLDVVNLSSFPTYP
jgi:hypothetical protein